MGRKHYHVGSNVEGYMPESDVYTVSSLRAAISASREDAQRHVDEAYYWQISPAERKASGEPKPYMRGSKGEYWVNDGRSLDFHYWVSDACTCDDAEGED
jgi:hypothetical protein